MNQPWVYTCSSSWDDPEGWDGEGGGSRAQDGENHHFFKKTFFSILRSIKFVIIKHVFPEEKNKMKKKNSLYYYCLETTAANI